jgi:hypothetical protein
LIIYRLSFKNILADIFSYYKQDIGPQKALKKAYYTQVLLMLNKLNLKITYKLFIKLVFVLKINFFKAFTVLTNGHVFFNLINYILTVNKQLFFLKDKRAKVIKDN